MRPLCFFDYTCGYSFRIWRWIEEQVRVDDPTILLPEWRPFSLKEVNRDGAASVFEAVDDPALSVLALAVGAALAGGAGDFGSYHSSAFEAFHTSDHRVTRDDLLRMAEDAGADATRLWRDRSRWIDAVATSHHDGIARWGVFGTPTLVLDDAAVYLKMASIPSSADEGARLWGALTTLVVSHPDLLEIKRPAAPQSGPGAAP